MHIRHSDTYFLPLYMTRDLYATANFLDSLSYPWLWRGRRMACTSIRCTWWFRLQSLSTSPTYFLSQRLATPSSTRTATSEFLTWWCMFSFLTHDVCLSVCLSVRPSVTRRIKTTKSRITQTTPYDGPGTLIFLCQRSRRNSDGVIPNEGAE